MANSAHSTSHSFALAIPAEADLYPAVYKPFVLLDDATSQPPQAMVQLVPLETRTEWQFLDIELTCPPAEILPPFTMFRTNTNNSVYRPVEQKKANES